MLSEIHQIIVERYPSTNSQKLADELNLSIYQLRRYVKKHKIAKTESYLKSVINKMHYEKERAYQNNRVVLKPNEIQDNIIIGSLLGDGSLARYGRSKESHYREHGCIAQNDYRKWKATMLSTLHFKYHEDLNAAGMKSISNALFSTYHQLFYENGRKRVTPEILERLTHPLGLLCLYLDDGSLVIDRYIRNNTIHLFPRITIYSQSFTEQENLLLRGHIYNQFNISFILKKRNDGHGVVLQCNYRDDIIRFLDLLKPYTSDRLLHRMCYKLDLNHAMMLRSEEYKKNYPNCKIINDRII
ncbi:MAG: hypothetical protein LCH34_07675 [Firmicutes bacterium]|nr:hypothetical protein [Bacillota bacterium]